MHVGIEFDFELHIQLQKALLELFQLLGDIEQLRVVVVASDQFDFR